MTAVPPISLTGGTAGPSDGAATSSGVSGTGDLVFKGSSNRDNSTSLLAQAGPIIIGVAAIWFITRRK